MKARGRPDNVAIFGAIDSALGRMRTMNDEEFPHLPIFIALVPTPTHIYPSGTFAMITFERDDCRFNYRVAGIALHNGAVLVHRAENDPFWCLPGGRCEMGEDAAGALHREMIEEIGAEPVVGPLAWIVENFFTYEGVRNHELGFYFTMRFPDGSPLYGRGETFDGYEPGVRLIYRWVPLEELASLVVKPSFIAARIASMNDIVEHIVHVE
jgi:8-oxo-dGTP pyrophosphatase MutT (NUDIX family)